MSPGTGLRLPAHAARRDDAPAPRRTAVQVVLIVVAAASLVMTVSMWLVGNLPYTLLAMAVLVVAIAMMIRRIVVARSLTVRLPWRRGGDVGGQGKGGQGEQGQQGQGTAGQAYPPGSQGHPFPCPGGHQQRSAQHAPPLPLGSRYAGEHEGRRPDDQHPDKHHQDASQALLSGQAQPAPQAQSLLSGPPVFGASSAPGQAPWHLPVGAAPSGLAADAARLGDLEVRAASMVGAGHRCEEPAGPRQDAYALGRTADGRFLVIAVADGVSQSKYSDLGARVAVSAAVRELVRMLDAGGWPAIDIGMLYRVIAGEMVGTGRNRGIPEKDICSILITAVIPAWPQRDGTRKIWASWLGDVSLWINRDGRLSRITGEEKTGLDRNALNAVLPFSPDEARQDTMLLEVADRVAVMTDGLSDSFGSVAGVLGYFAAQWAGPPPHPAAFLHSLCYDGPGQTDDRTAIVVWCGRGDPDGQRPAAPRRPA